MSGWIKLNRSITDNFLWQEKPFSKAQAWIDLLLHANHKPVKLSIKARVIPVDRGQQARSEVTLAEAWGWSRGKVRRFLNVLECERMIVQQTDNLTSIISVCNYSEYQDGDTASSTADGTPDGTALGTAHGTQLRMKRKKEEKKGDFEGFDLFWESYPRKVSKQSALKAWNKLKPVNGTVVAIMAGLNKSKGAEQWTKDGGQFIPYASTWLNDRRWEDEGDMFTGGQQTKNYGQGMI